MSSCGKFAGERSGVRVYFFGPLPDIPAPLAEAVSPGTRKTQQRRPEGRRGFQRTAKGRKRVTKEVMWRRARPSKRAQIPAINCHLI